MMISAFRWRKSCQKIQRNYHYNNIGSTTKLTDNNGNVIQSYEYGAYGEVLSGDTKITPFLYNGQLGVMTDDNGLYYMRARYYNVNIKRFINQDVVHGSINVSQSLNRYSYVQGNPIKLTDPFGLSPLDRLNWKNLGHAILNGLGLIPVIGEAFDIANAIWYAHDGEYGMAVLSMMSALPMIGNIASGIMTAAKITTAAKIVSTVCKVVSNAATFTQAAIGGVNNAKAIVKNMINGKLFSEDTAKNLVSFGINAFTAATSGKNLLSSSKELKKVVGDSVGSKWGKKAKKEPRLECNLQFFGKKNGCETKLDYVTSNGLVLETTPNKTTTVLGTYKSDTAAILDELGNVKSLDFGPRDGGFNLLNTPDELYVSPNQFWNEYNKPWLDNAIVRNDIFKIATEPTWDNLTRVNMFTGKTELTGFGREYTYLKNHGYYFDAVTKTMIK